MKISIIVATHKKYRMPEDPCYIPLQVGSALTHEIGILRDDSGENISLKNQYYCELTGMYWMWKNIDADYVGLVHYRRYFTAENSLKTIFSRNPYALIAGHEELESILKESGMILPKQRHYLIESLYSHYAHTHYGEHLDLTRSIIRKNCPDYEEAFQTVMKSRSGHMFNMFVMSKSRCDAYCSWLFPILEELENRLDLKSYSDYQARALGRISELLLNVWVVKNGFRYREMPVVNVEHTNWARKIWSFLRAKYSDRKYSDSF